MAKRTRYRSGLSVKDRRGLAITAAAVATTVVMIALSFALKDRGSYNADTLCPTDRTYPRTVLIVDKTDVFSPAQSSFLRAEIIRLRESLTQYEKLSIYVLNEANFGAPKPVFELCNPGSGEDANALYQNPRKIKQRFDERFGRPLDQALVTLTQGEEAKSSPIMEMIQNVAFAENLQGTSDRKRLYLISDMLQHTPVYSQYKSAIDFDAFARTDQLKRVQVALPNVAVYIFYLFRRGQEKLQTAKHTAFWERYFDSMGAKLVDVRYGP